MEESKSEGPTACLTFLGLELDSAARIIRLPQDKLARLRQSLADWGSRKAVRKRELLSLIGHLQHAAKVRQGRSFLRWLIYRPRRGGKPLRSICPPEHWTWWRTFAHQWNGTSMLYTYSPQLHIYSDASGSWGCAALTGSAWFQLQWPPSAGECHISAKEMISIVIAAILWGREWQGLSIQFHSDNTAVVALLNSGDDSMMHLMRCLTFVAASFNFIFSSAHIPGTENVLADALSRNKAKLFLSLSPQARRLPSPIPRAVLELLLMEKPDWTSRAWIRLWNSIFTTP